MTKGQIEAKWQQICKKVVEHEEKVWKSRASAIVDASKKRLTPTLIRRKKEAI